MFRDSLLVYPVFYGDIKRRIKRREGSKKR